MTQCNAITAKGSQCKRQSQKNALCCFQHMKNVQSVQCVQSVSQLTDSYDGSGLTQAEKDLIPTYVPPPTSYVAPPNMEEWTGVQWEEDGRKRRELGNENVLYMANVNTTKVKADRARILQIHEVVANARKLQLADKKNCV